MSKKTYVKSDIVKDLHGHFQAIPNNDVERIVDKIFQYLGNAVSEGRSIEIRSWGTLHIKDMGEREGRNPATGEKIIVPPKRKIRWKSSKLLNYRLNKEKVIEE